VIQCPNNFQTPTAGNQNAQRTHAAHDPSQAERKCYACGEKCHLANRCSNPHPRPNQPTIGTPAHTRGANSIPIAIRQNYARGRVNHVAVEEAQKLQMLSLVWFSSTLFDYGASHCFISAAYVEKHNLPIALLKSQMIVSFLIGDMPVDISYAAPQAHRIVNVALHWEYSPGIVFIFFKGRKHLYHV
jgi:hypothetical protein